MTDSEVLDLIANKVMTERTVRCTDVAHPRHMQVGRLLAATTAAKSGGSGCMSYVGFGMDPTNEGSPSSANTDGFVAVFLDATQIEFQD